MRSINRQNGRTSQASPRLDAIDALRGLAMVWMTLFHFCFDLSHFGYLQADFYRDPFWTWQRSMILSLFLVCAGLGQAVALQQAQSWARFGRRWGQIVLCAVLVSAGSYLMYPRSFIYFGVLHGMAVMLVVARLSAGWGPGLWLLGALAWGLQFIAPWLHQAWGPQLVWLDQPAWHWLGLVSHKPVTEDYVPLVPWLGVLCWGLAAGQWLLRLRPHWLARPLSPAARPLVVLGRWSLSYYLLHQPVLIGALLLLGSVR